MATPGQRDDLSSTAAKPACPSVPPSTESCLEFRETSIRFELTGDVKTRGRGPPGAEDQKSPTLRPWMRTGKDLRLVADPLAKNLTFTAWSSTRAHFPLSGDEPTFVLQSPPNKHMTGEVAFPGREPVPLDFSTPEPGGEVL